ncbi:MAG: diacylglycerol kinase family protein [Candidatus Nealsonbacteria bacterium]|nr:diacylglycerol kinase family protein [Candidatus Nealsonbacteria bacterium]
MESRHSLFKSFKFAFNGLKTAIIKGRNFRIQILIGAASVVLGVIYRISSSEWLSLILIIASVLVLELINTAVEEIVNIVSPDIQERAKIAKDVSAASVLIAAVASIFIGAVIFIPRIFY